jgi:hypothetical protein
MQVGGLQGRIITTQTIDCNKHEISIQSKQLSDDFLFVYSGYYGEAFGDQD